MTLVVRDAEVTALRSRHPDSENSISRPLPGPRRDNCQILCHHLTAEVEWRPQLVYHTGWLSPIRERVCRAAPDVRHA